MKSIIKKRPFGSMFGSVAISIGLSIFSNLHAEEPVYKDSTQPIEARVDDLLSKMTLEEKVSYITGGKLENQQEAIRGLERLDIPDFVIAHGPFGMKMRYLNERKQVMVLAGTYMPVSIAMAATWDQDLVEEITQVIGKEMNAVGARANAGPAMNIIRDTRGGRSFEYFTEDPFLNAEITAAYTTGIQSEKIAATLKHYVANNQELHRHGLDVTVSDRALRELYLPGFEKAVEEADAKIIMGAYNKVNGVYSCENDVILNQILRDEWGFDGFVLSDWGGTQTTVDSANNGLDVEMPSERWYGKKLLTAVNEGKVSTDTIDQMVRNVLKVVFWSGAFDHGPLYERDIIRSEEHLAVARKASAASMVLLKNEDNLLPFNYDGVKKIAVIGPNGDYGQHFRGGKYHPGLYQGGGSGQVTPEKRNVVTPFAGIKNNAPEGVEVVFAPGSYAESGYGKIPTKYLKTPDTGEEGMRATYYNNADFNGTPVKTEVTKTLDYFWVGEIEIPEAGIERGDKNRFSVDFEATLTAPATREYGFELRNIEGGFAQIYIDDQLIVENTRGGRVNWNAMGSIALEEGKEYALKVKFAKRGHFADLSINWDYENLAYLEEAKALAESADLVILTVGLAGQMGETEAGDRSRLELYPAQENLIKEITKVNPNSAVAIIAGSSITMDAWLEGAPAVLTAWYPGEQGGNALSDVLFGESEPGGRLPITFPVAYEQYPDNYYTFTKKIKYDEGVFVGYRYFDRKRMETLFPFGHGLSYTTFSYGDVSVSSKAKIGDTVTVSVELTNTGDRSGSEVVQLYVHDRESSLPRPPQELKAFEKVTLDPGETKTVTMELDKRAFAFYSEEAGDWVVEPGEFELLIGSSSRNIQAAELIELY